MPAIQHSSPMALWAWLAARMAQMALVAAALAAVAVTALAAFGSIPWLKLPLALESGASVEAGPGVQIGIALFLVTLCGFLPASGRIMQLEMSHRRFHAGMEDVAHAYYLAHSADRQEVFRLSHEFDAVRERLAFLRNHPDLSTLEPEVLELAAQMSHVGRDLAQVYSDEKVSTARELLAQRGDQASQIEANVIRATRVTEELVARLAEVEDQEERTTGLIARLQTELDTLLPRLGLASAQVEQAMPKEASASAVREAQHEIRTFGQPAMTAVRG